MLFVLTGPESTAKSTLARILAEQFEAPMVEERARAYLSDDGAYLPSDLLAIAREQQQAEARAGAGVGFADTDLQVVHLWWQEKYGPAPYVLSQAYACQGPRHYLLCRPDIEWAPDPLREHPQERGRLFELYRQDLLMRQLSYSEVSGQGQARVDCAVAAVTKILNA